MMCAWKRRRDRQQAEAHRDARQREELRARRRALDMQLRLIELKRQRPGGAR